MSSYSPDKISVWAVPAEYIDESTIHSLWSPSSSFHSFSPPAALYARGLSRHGILLDLAAVQTLICFDEEKNELRVKVRDRSDHSIVLFLVFCLTPMHLVL